jgi:endothelin-converting enzyme/putative endopeptidase
MKRLFFAVTMGLAVHAVMFGQTTPEAEKVWAPIAGFDKSAMDLSADPCVDFNQYACGNFSKLHPIPADLASFDQFSNLYEFNTQAMHGLLTKAAADHAAAGTNEQKIGDYYATCMDTDAIEKAGLTPLKAELNRIDALKDRDQLTGLLAHYQRISVDAFLGFGSQQDFKDATREIAAFDQGGLGLPEKDYYFRTDEASVKTREQYVAHLAKVLQLIGQPAAEATENAKQIMAMETALAKASMGVVERRDPENVYHIVTVKAFAAETNPLNVNAFLKEVGSPTVETVNVASPEFFTTLNGILQNTSLATIRNYLRIKLIESESMRLPKVFDQEYFDFYGLKLTGTPQQEPRWQRCVVSTDSALGEALGKVYVQQYFAGDSKAKTLQEVKDIEAAMDKDLDTLTWMGAATKLKAKEKLHAVVDKIGYPDKWRDYSSLEVTPTGTIANSLRAREFATAYDLNKIGKPVDKGAWSMTPPTVNAYYDDSMNTINFPAGILQPAFYDKTASDATNYGHIGAVVGHELTHGFDDEGRKFDAQGNLKDWWTAEDKKNFTERTDCLVDEYGSFVAIDNLHVNGKLTLGENTADNGGLRLALMALTASADKSGLDLDKKDATGYTPKQQLFLGWAQNWCSTERPEMVRMQVQTDPHSPDAIRTKGVLVNVPEFGKAFGCKTGQPMVPEKICRVW